MNLQPPPAQNRLEEVLELAASGDADAQERFPNVLLNSELYVMADLDGPVERIDGNYATLSDQSRLSIWTAEFDGEVVVPAYTSPVRFRVARGSDERFVGLPARVVFSSRPKELKVVLNPGVWHGTAFLPDEIEILLGGGWVDRGSRGGEVMLGLAAERPDDLVEQLLEWLQTRRDVVAVRLAQIFDETTGEPPHPLVGIELADGARPEVVFPAIPEFRGPVDVVPIPDHPLGSWLVANGEEIYRA